MGVEAGPFCGQLQGQRRGSAGLFRQPLPAAFLRARRRSLGRGGGRGAVRQRCHGAVDPVPGAPRGARAGSIEGKDLEDQIMEVEVWEVVIQWSMAHKFSPVSSLRQGEGWPRSGGAVHGALRRTHPAAARQPHGQRREPRLRGFGGAAVCAQGIHAGPWDPRGNVWNVGGALLGHFFLEVCNHSGGRSKGCLFGSNMTLGVSFLLDLMFFQFFCASRVSQATKGAGCSSSRMHPRVPKPSDIYPSCALILMIAEPSNIPLVPQLILPHMPTRICSWCEGIPSLICISTIHLS